jgi:L-alanine-DL-glutamate epimerase-like enolase superfamily enzyme
MAARAEAPIERVDVSAYTIPTDEPESDGTFEWDETTIVVVHLSAGGETGLGYTYGPKAVAVVVEDLLAPALVGSDPFTNCGPR